LIKNRELKENRPRQRHDGPIPFIELLPPGAAMFSKKPQLLGLP